MIGSAEKNLNPTEIKRGERYTEQGNALYVMFATQLSRLHFVRSEEAFTHGFGRRDLVRSVGETWFLEPRYGKGFTGSIS